MSQNIRYVQSLNELTILGKDSTHPPVFIAFGDHG